jgi:hypothetical protein
MYYKLEVLKYESTDIIALSRQPLPLPNFK